MLEKQNSEEMGVKRTFLTFIFILTAWFCRNDGASRDKTKVKEDQVLPRRILKEHMRIKCKPILLQNQLRIS